MKKGIPKMVPFDAEFQARFYYVKKKIGCIAIFGENREKLLEDPFEVPLKNAKIPNKKKTRLNPLSKMF